MKFTKRLNEAVFGPAPLINAEPPPKFDKMKFLQKLLRRRPKRPYQFVNKDMTRGVQAAMERAQRPLRLARIYGSMRQGVAAAAQRRADYLKRRTARWKKLVETEAPRMFEQELRRIGAI